MNRTAAPPLPLRPAHVAVAAVLAALLVGSALSQGVALGLGLLLGLCYAPIVLLNLPLGVILWIPLVLIDRMAIFSGGPSAAALLILLAWVGTLANTQSVQRRLLRTHRTVLVLVWLWTLWLTLTLAWAEDSDLAFGKLWEFWVPGLVFLVIVTTIDNERHARMAVGAIVVAALLSVLVGFFGSGFVGADSAFEAASETERRLTGGTGDPNFLAAGIVPAIVLAVALAAGARRRLTVPLLMTAAAVLTVGFAATESRGGLIGAIVAVIVAFVVSRGSRAPLTALMGFLVACAAVWFAINPAAWDRIASFDSEGTGRSSLWEVGVRVWEERPFTGVGLENFTVRAPDHTREPGSLEFVNLIAERSHVVHNTYLQLLAELGVIGLLLYLAAVALCLRRALQAARRFEAGGDAGMASLARGVFVAGVAMLAAFFFISGAQERTLWILLAMGPVLYGIAGRRARDAEPAGSEPENGERPPGSLRTASPRALSGLRA